jgi:hypothetical protein
MSRTTTIDFEFCFETSSKTASNSSTVIMCWTIALSYGLLNALLCLALFCTPGVVGGAVILPSMSQLV